MGGHKGGDQTSTTNQQGNTSTQIPGWLSNASQYAIDQAMALSNKPYTPYTGQMVANQAPDTTQAYSEIEGLQGSANPAFNASANAYGGLLGQVNPQSAGQINNLSNQLYGNYRQDVLNPQAALYGGSQGYSQGLLGNYMGNGSPAGQVGANAQALMSPYAASVIAPALQAGQQQLALANQGIAKQANDVGAFGGSRQGVQEGVAAAQTALGTQQNIANMLNTGWGQALTAGSALEQQGYGAANTLAQQGYNTAGALGQMAGTGYQNALTSGQGLANTNLQAGLTAAQQLPGQAVQQAQLGQQQAGALQAAGTAQQQYQQQLLNAQMGQFYGAQDQPYQNLNTLLSAVGSVPYGTTTGTSGWSSTKAETNPGIMNQITGAIGLLGNIVGGVAGI